MRKKFSERYEFTKPRDTFQIESIDKRLKNRIWNQIKKLYFNSVKVKNDVRLGPENIEWLSGDHKIIRVEAEKLNWIIDNQDYVFFVQVYDKFFGSEDQPSRFLDAIEKKIKSKYHIFSWYEVYDFIEYISETYHNHEINETFKNKINEVLEDEMSAYRFVDNYITPIIDEVEIQEIEEAIESPYGGVKMHLSKALELLSDRENPDYQNSIKESISAVESLAKTITGLNKDLGACIKAMDLDIQKQFIKTLSGLYSWTSQADGMRHAYTGEELKTSFDEAKFMLVTCSAFVNYMIAKKDTQ